MTEYENNKSNPEDLESELSLRGDDHSGLKKSWRKEARHETMMAENVEISIS